MTEREPLKQEADIQNRTLLQTARATNVTSMSLLTGLLVTEDHGKSPSFRGCPSASSTPHRERGAGVTCVEHQGAGSFPRTDPSGQTLGWRGGRAWPWVTLPPFCSGVGCLCAVDLGCTSVLSGRWRFPGWPVTHPRDGSSRSKGVLAGGPARSAGPAHRHSARGRTRAWLSSGVSFSAPNCELRGGDTSVLCLRAHK